MISAVLSSFFTYFLTKNLTYKEDLILKHLSLIERIKTIHYPLVAAKAKYAEKYGDIGYHASSVEEDAKDFQNDLKTTLNI